MTSQGYSMRPTISKVLFYSLIFAIGLAPTGAVWLMKINQVAWSVEAFSILSIVLAAVIVPIILLQNAYLFFKRHDSVLDQKLGGLARFYMVLNALCLLSWIVFLVWDKV